MWPIQQLSFDQFGLLLQGLDWERQVQSIHLHHTWRPNQVQWRGQTTMNAMRRVHMEERGFSDIAQHLTIDPFGGLWTGRNWNRAPASCKGRDSSGRPWNGDSRNGPFMIEIVGDFDDGKDRFDGPQKAAAEQVIGLLIWRFGLFPSAESVLGHVQMYSGKSCPGTSLTAEDSNGDLRLNLNLYAAFDREANQFLQSRGHPTELPKCQLPVDLQEFLSATRAPPLAEKCDACEVPEDSSAAESIRSTARAQLGLERGNARGAIDRKYLDLFGHVINTSRGLLLESAEQAERAGKYYTSQDELDGAFFEPLIDYERSLPAEQPLRLMFHAHGGLVKESSALDYALSHVPWWRKLDVFPFYFVWETGLLETVFERKRGVAGTRGWLDRLFDGTDWLIEKATAAAGGAVWRRMKANAELCSAENWHRSYADMGGESPPQWASQGIPGGARSFVRELLATLERLPRERAIEFHAVGHSAGSIYHAYFLPMLVDELAQRGPRLRDKAIKSLQLLAPAIQLETFEEQLAGHLGKRVGQMTMFTMDDKRERDDNASIYQKSLLYLVNQAFEATDEPGLLGLQACLEPYLTQGATDTSKAFARGDARVFYSNGKDEKQGTVATRHGDFDNDPVTMTSVAKNIGVEPAAGSLYPTWVKRRPKRRPYKKRGFGPDLLDSDFVELDGGNGAARKTQAERGFALCIGIDAYPAGAALSGCVNDARNWGAALQSLGYEIEYLINEQASRATLQQRISATLQRAQPGNSVILQFAGHGTQLEDLDGDELSGLDQAYVPQDYQSSGCLLDDELYQLLIPAARRGVSITLFFDTCHSGSASRFAPVEGVAVGHRRARFLSASAEMNALQKKVSAPLTERRARSRGSSQVEWIHLAACLDKEYAYESNGSGDFSRVAVPLLKAAQDAGWSGAQFLDAVRREMGSPPRQTPTMMPTSAVGPALPSLDGREHTGQHDASELISALELALEHARRLS